MRAIIRRDRRALAFTILGCAISASVAVFQFAVFTSFLRAAQVVPEVIGASAWVMGHGVEAFDFPYPIPEDYAALVSRCFPGSSVDRVVFGFAPWISPLGRRGNVAVVGYDRSGLAPRSFVVDVSDRDRLDLASGARDGEIGGVSMSLAGFDDRLATFLGAPYAIVGLRDAIRALAAPPDRISFVAIHAADRNTEVVRGGVACARRMYPEVTIASSEEFRRSSALYWLMKTGAGAAILIASALASLLLLIILANGIGRFCQRRHRDFMTMLGHGAEPDSIAGILLCIVCIFAFGSTMLAVAVLPIADLATEGFVPWVEVKPVDLAFAFGIALLGAATGFVAALGECRRFEAVDVFRTA